MDGTIRTAFAGFGSAVPEKTMSNFDFEKMIDTSDEWIYKRTGIRQRHICSENDSTATLAAEAAKKALKSANITADDLDLIIVATVTGEMPFPSTACFVQEAIGAHDIPAFDIAAACSGFVYGLTVADKFVTSGQYKKVLLIAADCLTKWTDWEDRGTCILFGDGAGAIVLEPTTEPNRGVLHTEIHAEGSGWDLINIPGGGTRHITTKETIDQKLPLIKMKGRDVYKFAVDKMQSLIGSCMEKCNLTVDDVDKVVPHQVNIRIIESATQKNGFPIEKVYVNIDKMGNTSGASIPLALDEAWRNGSIKKGDTLVFCAFGAGLTWAGATVTL